MSSELQNSRYTEQKNSLAEHGQQAIAQGSKSFAMASRLFDDEMRHDVQMLYAWCRHCDDVIDGQTMGEDAPDIALSNEEQARRLEMLIKDTQCAMAGEVTGNPAFDGFSLVARKHELPRQYPMDLLGGFSMDVESRLYTTLDDTLGYCYGVAGCVGVMMAIVMGVPHTDSHTLDRACDLGLAFQLTNICRDIVDDAKADRIYVPATLLKKHGVGTDASSILDTGSRDALSLVAIELLDEADRYYTSATQGIRMLPPRAGAAIAAARNVYRDIGRMIRTRGAHAWDSRTYTSKSRKIFLALTGLASGIPQSVFLKEKTAAPREGLWQRPLRQMGEQD